MEGRQGGFDAAAGHMETELDDLGATGVEREAKEVLSAHRPSKSGRLTEDGDENGSLPASKVSTLHNSDKASSALDGSRPATVTPVGQGSGPTTPSAAELEFEPTQ